MFIVDPNNAPGMSWTSKFVHTAVNNALVSVMNLPPVSANDRAWRNMENTNLKHSSVPGKRRRYVLTFTDGEAQEARDTLDEMERQTADDNSTQLSSSPLPSSSSVSQASSLPQSSEDSNDDDGSEEEVSDDDEEEEEEVSDDDDRQSPATKKQKCHATRVKQR